MKSALALAAGVLALYLLRLDTAAGMIVDDGWYVVLAKALSQGDGFRLISSATVAIMPTVPPGFPLVLAPLYFLNPHFPSNVWLLKSASIASMMGIGAVVFVYLSRYRQASTWMAAGTAVATVVTPAFVFLATSTVMAECVFTLAQVSTVLWLDRVVRDGQPSRQRRDAIVAAVLASATLLVRTAGLATLLTGVVYLLKERAFRPAAAYVLASALCLAPWTLYSISHAPTEAQAREHGGTIAYAYSDLLQMSRPGDPFLRRAGVSDVAARVGRNLVNVFGRDVGGVLVPSFLRGPTESGEEVVSLGGSNGLTTYSMGGSPATMAISFVLSTIVLVGFIAAGRRRVTAAEILVALSVAMILIVPVMTFRYVLPLAPFLLFYFLSGIAAVQVSSAVRIAVLCIVGLHLQDHTQYIAAKMRNTTPPDWLGDARAAGELTDWMNANLGPGEVASTNPGLVYLLTGRKTVATDDFARGWGRWRAAGIRYIVALRPLQQPPTALGYRLLYQSPTRRYWVIEISGA